MTNCLTASDIAARRIREARQRRKLRVQDLADLCEKAGFPRLTHAVITNLETRRRPEREISAEELLALAWVLEVPPVQLLSPIGGDEVLEVVPGEHMSALEAPGWLADDDELYGPVRAAGVGDPGLTERALRHRNRPLTLVRQVRVVTDRIRYREDMQRHKDKEPDLELYSDAGFRVYGIRLLHFLDALGGLGYAPPDLGDVMEILARHGVPATLAELDQAGSEEEGES